MDEKINIRNVPTISETADELGHLSFSVSPYARLFQTVPEDVLGTVVWEATQKLIKTPHSYIMIASFASCTCTIVPG